ncbi:hypothetical protein SAMN06265365_110148 [Tistlia consotensis]|uniref:DUF1109 domain-containing protein n=1 Tax=Tistlia consotensis USBA 355 TaxID=560819 RepID=A0A1Y6BYA7_9PROT|nr:NrsF family protein [Tistlia consotensis]SMF26466.1 hypothetical protein SAMN05428998_1098 [Tistlia consotensis USBA 355]SNR67150.1 hypothetical protein SAMN06265365_110148 [Tistlia consotensis]
MITTPDLIEALATDLKPVRRLRRPLLRAAFLVALLTVGQGLRSDLAQRLRDAGFLFGVAGALSTGILAAAAAFLLSLPDRSRLWLLLPAPALVMWLSSIGYQCLTNWVRLEPDGIGLGDAAHCFATLVLTSLPLSLILPAMLSHAAALRSPAVVLAGALAVAGIAATALSLLHALDATVMILIWNLGTVGLLVGLASAFGEQMLSWFAPRPAPPAA